MIRDEKTKALLNRDEASLKRYKYDREQARRISELENKVEQLSKIVDQLLQENTIKK